MTQNPFDQIFNDTSPEESVKEELNTSIEILKMVASMVELFTVGLGHVCTQIFDKEK